MGQAKHEWRSVAPRQPLWGGEVEYVSRTNFFRRSPHRTHPEPHSACTALGQHRGVAPLATVFGRMRTTRCTRRHRVARGGVLQLLCEVVGYHDTFLICTYRSRCRQRATPVRGQQTAAVRGDVEWIAP
jgi:hypothetical protein